MGRRKVEDRPLEVKAIMKEIPGWLLNGRVAREALFASLGGTPDNGPRRWDVLGAIDSLQSQGVVLKRDEKGDTFYSLKKGPMTLKILRDL